MTKITINDIKKTPVTNSSSELINMYQYYTRPDIRGVQLCSTQRGPAWNKNEINISLSDIYNESISNSSFHFFGCVLLSGNKNESSHKLIDGQQRTLSGLLFLAVVRDMLNSMPKSTQRIKNLKQLCNKLLFNTVEYNEQSRIFLQLKNSTRAKDKENKKYLNAFKNIIIGKFKNNYTKDSYRPIRLIGSAYISIKKDIKRVFKKNSRSSYTDKVNTLYQLSNAFLHKFVIATIGLSSSKFNNNITFETTNDRGKGLTIADKVKSQLIMATHTQNSSLSHFQQDWQKHISDTLQGNSKFISDFIVDLWHAKYNHCARRKIPSKLNKKLEGGLNVNDFMKDLRILAPVYNALLHPISDKMFKHTKKIKFIIKELNDMGFTQYYSLILSIYKFRKDIHDNNKTSDKDYYKNTFKNNIYHIMRKITEVEMRRRIRHEVHAKYTTEANYIWKNHRSVKISDILNALNTYSSRNKSTQTACTIYDHRYINKQNNKSMLMLTYMLAKVYDYRNNDFNNNSNQIYTEIFKNKEFRAIHISKKMVNNKTNVLVNNIGNWTILETNLLTNINPESPNPSDLREALKKSNLTSNLNIASSLSQKNNTLNNFINIIKDREKTISKAYVNAWIKHTKSQQNLHNN